MARLFHCAVQRLPPGSVEVSLRSKGHLRSSGGHVDEGDEVTLAPDTGGLGSRERERGVDRTLPDEDDDGMRVRLNHHGPVARVDVNSTFAAPLSEA